MTIYIRTDNILAKEDAYQIYQSQARFLAWSVFGKCFPTDQATVIYDWASEEFQKKIKDCIYDIARTAAARQSETSEKG